MQNLTHGNLAILFIINKRPSGRKPDGTAGSRPLCMIIKAVIAAAGGARGKPDLRRAFSTGNILKAKAACAQNRLACRGGLKVLF
jgi:hypothetical protein